MTTDDQNAFRTYAAAALPGVISVTPKRFEGYTDMWANLSAQVAMHMIAEEKKRFPANRELAAGFAYDVKVAIDPLAGSPDADNEDKNGSYTQ